LFFATAARITRWIAIALLIGVAAMAVAIVSGVASYVSFSPAIVAALHAGGYFVVQSRKTQPHVRASA
jgi:nicotinate-nucleotide pyrophosphorylase